MASSSNRILMVALPAFGHIIPLLELAKKFIDNNFTITFALSATKVEETKKRDLLTPEQQKHVTFYALNDGLPADFDSFPTPTHITEIQDAMQPPLEILLKSINSLGSVNVKAVITDFWIVGPTQHCKERGIPCYLFNTASAYAILLAIATAEDTPIQPDETFFKPPPNQDSEVLVLQKGSKNLLLLVKSLLPLASGIINNSYRELEGFVAEAVAGYPPLANMPITFVGPILMQEKPNHSSPIMQNVAKWLGSKENGSVVYVSFGSMVFPSTQQLTQIANALVGLKKPFIWSLRANLYHHLPVEVQERIKRQFDGTGQDDFLILPWVSQQIVLDHPAVKVFVSHCGWNSTLEAISTGKPIVGWPMFGDQHKNAGFLAKVGAGVTIPETGLKGARIVPADEISAAISKVGAWGQGSQGSYFETAQKMQKAANAAVADNGSSSKELTAVIESIAAF